MRLTTSILAALALTCATATAAPPKSNTVEQTTLAAVDTTPKKDTQLADMAAKKLLYTTYFYTAGEAIVHGYEANTDVRIVSLKENRTVWQGKVNEGQTVNVPTGQGVFAFLADKKASILVGTPSMCTAVGYYLRDQNGTFLSKKFYTQLPSSTAGADSQVIVWAWKDANVRITNMTNDTVMSTVKLKAGERHVISTQQLQELRSHTLDISADTEVSVQVYYDQGFHAPSIDGRVAGKLFRTYVGKTTEGHNDLNLINYGRETTAKVVDIDTKEVIWKGKIPTAGLHSLRLTARYVEITADDEISALVAPHNFQGYAEHHFSGGHEGTGIESSFITTTSEQIWVFSYFDNNPVRILSMDDKPLWEGTLNAGHAQGYFPGAGNYKVKSTSGVSVMGGSAACGAEYSPAGGLFRIDEEMLKVATQIVEARKAEAAKKGKTLSASDLNAPLSPKELQQVADEVEKNTGNKMAPAAVESRMKSIQVY